MLLLFVGAATSCSESDGDDTDEYANWQVRNEAYFATLEDSLSRGGSAWKKVKNFTKDENTTTANTDYIYVKVLEQGSGTASPTYTDLVRISYRGRLIPTVNYPRGFVFDQTYTGNYSLQTTGVISSQISYLCDGVATALQHMHNGDRWLVYIPYQLGYGTTSNDLVPAYSVMIFDLVLLDFVPEGEDFEEWSSRQW